MAERVLVVDDSPFMRKLVHNALRGLGFEVVGEAGDGKAAAEAYVTLRPDFVTLDLVMPGTDGFAALKAIREGDPAARIVIVSGGGEASLVERALREGAAAYLVKPFKDADVARAMATARGAAPRAGA